MMPLDIENRPMMVRAFGKPTTVDEATRTVEVVWTTGAAVERTRLNDDWERETFIEELEVSEAAIRLDRLNNGAPLLDGHDDWGGITQTLGVVERAWIDGAVGRAVVRFASDAIGDAAFARVRDGIVSLVSVGYVTHAVLRTEASASATGRAVERATDWEPYELSFVTIPADPDARTRNTPPTFPCAIRRAQQEARMAEETAADTPAPTANETSMGALLSRSIDALTSIALGSRRRAVRSDDEKRMDDDEETRGDDDDGTNRDDEDGDDGGDGDDDSDGDDDAERAATIVETCRSFGAGDRAAEMIRSGAPVRDIRKQLQEERVGKSDQRRGHPSGVTVTRDETETRRDGLVEALAHRVAPRRFEATERSREFGRMGLRGLAVEVCENAGIRTRGLSNGDIAQKAMRVRSALGGHTTTDFAYITTEVMQRVLREEYTLREPTWQALSTARTATDFRELHSVRFGGDLSFSKVNESGEYRVASLTDEAEGLQVTKDGVEVRISFEAVVNDDLGAFQRIPGRLSRSARRSESRAVWSAIVDNVKLKSDNKALYHADHGNLAAGAALSVETLGAARKLMWEQLDFKGAKDDFLEITPDLLYVPPALETEALRFVAQTTPASDDEVNPYKGTLQVVVEPRLGASAGGSDTAWMLFSSEMPPVEHAYLDGYEEGPEIIVKEDFNPDGVSMLARHFFGAAPVEYRGTVKNPGI